MSPTVLRLREVRVAHALSQVELGKRAKVRQATISGLEAGHIRRIDLAILDRLAAALGIPPAALLGWEPAAPGPKARGKPRRARRR